MSINSKLGQVPIPEDKCAVTLIHYRNDMHTQLVVERRDLNVDGQPALKILLADFEGRKFSYNKNFRNYENLNIGTVKCREIREIRYLLKSKTWMLSSTDVDSVWRNIQEEAFESASNPRLYYALGSQSIAASEQFFYQTSHPLLVAIRNEDPVLFQKLYESATLLEAESPLRLFEKITRTHCHWMTAERLEKLIPNLEERFQNNMDAYQDFIEAYQGLKRCINLISSNPDLEKKHTDWAYNFGYTKWLLYTPPNHVVFAYWIAIYHLIHTIITSPNHEHTITVKKLTPDNCDTWAAKKASLMGADVKDELTGVIALPAFRCLMNSHTRDHIELGAQLTACLFGVLARGDIITNITVFKYLYTVSRVLIRTPRNRLAEAIDSIAHPAPLPQHSRDTSGSPDLLNAPHLPPV